MDETKKLVPKKIDNNVTIGLIAGNFPLSLFNEWEIDCKKEYGNCRWMKIWHDHLAAKTSKELVEVYKQVQELTEEFDRLSDRVASLEMKTEKPSEDKQPLTIDGKTFK